MKRTLVSGFAQNAQIKAKEHIMRFSTMTLGRLLRSCPLALVALSLLASNADATHVLWVLGSASMNDGGTAAGSFVYEADTNTYSSINFTTTSGFALPGETYHDVTPGYGGANLGVTMVHDASLPNLTGSTFLAIQFATPLTNAGGVVVVLYGPYVKGTKQ
jgi:hypothetical protein